MTLQYRASEQVWSSPVVEAGVVFQNESLHTHFHSQPLLPQRRLASLHTVKSASRPGGKVLPGGLFLGAGSPELGQ